jgi:hypothetical protein
MGKRSKIPLSSNISGNIPKTLSSRKLFRKFFLDVKHTFSDVTLRALPSHYEKKPKQILMKFSFMNTQVEKTDAKILHDRTSDSCIIL